MPKMISHCNRHTAAVLSTVVLAGAGLSACGNGDRPSSASQPSGQAAGTAEGNSADRAFVAGMVPHHQSAVDMAQVALERGQSTFVKGLAQDIVDSQTKELATMRAGDDRLASAGVKAGKPAGGHAGMTDEKDPAQALKTADPFDAAFIKEMLPHHKAALPMAQAELDKGGDPELKKVAQAIVDGQTREISAMEKHAGAQDGTHGAQHSG
jgi:uncharacterized protein (DUF305 family)